MTEPAWVEHVIWWHVYPLGFTGVHPAGREAPHPFRHLAAWLDYAVDLGVSGIALGPVFASHSHGYDTIDHLRIDPRLGTEADFDEFVGQLRDRGLRLMLDGVFNHVGRDFVPPSSGAFEGSDNSAWFRTLPGGGFANFEGHGDLIALNHDSPAVADYVVDVMTHWLDRGAHAWRLDAAYAVPPAFWAGVVPRVRERHPDTYVVGEVLHGEYDAFVADARVDAVTQYELWKSTWSSLNDRNFFELDWTLQRHNGWLDTFVPLTFVGNHDVTRIASQLTDKRHLGHALALLLTLGGTPSVYYGDEQGYTGVKEERFGGDDQVRPVFPERPEHLAALGEPVFRHHRSLIGLRRRHPWLHRARTSVLHLSNEQFAYVAHDAEHALVVALNVSDEQFRVALPDGLTELLECQDAAISGSGLVFAPHGWAVVG